MSSYLEVLIDLMQKAGQNKELSGKQKKEFVISKMKELITLDNEIEDLLIAFIDLLIDVENGKLVINKNIKNRCIGCYSLFIKKSKKIKIPI